MIATVFVFPFKGNYVSADPPHYTHEGYIFDVDGNPVSGIEIKITNVDEEDIAYEESDLDGYYSIDFEEEDWTPPFTAIFETANAEDKGYFETAIEEVVTEEIYDWRADIYLTYKNLHDNGYIYCGDFELIEYGSFGNGKQKVDWNPSDTQQITANLDKTYDVMFDATLTHIREDECTHWVTGKIQTKSNGRTTNTIFVDKTYTTPHDEDWVPQHNHMGLNAGIYPSTSNCGFKLQIYFDYNQQWWPDGEGYAYKYYRVTYS